MDNLWAPWRTAYVEHIGEKKGKGCVFCAVLKHKKDGPHFVLFRTRLSFAVLNIYPFNAGHVLVLPLRHVAGLEQLTAAERNDLMEALVKVQGMIKKAFKPDGFNVGINLGHVAGAGIPEHLHIHIVPRWSGDVNFMPALAATKVIPTSLEKTWERLRAAEDQ